MGVSFRDKAFDIFRFFCENCRCKTVHGKREGIFGESLNPRDPSNISWQYLLAVKNPCSASPPRASGGESSPCVRPHTLPVLHCIGWSQSPNRQICIVGKRMILKERPEEYTFHSV